MGPKALVRSHHRVKSRSRQKPVASGAGGHGHLEDDLGERVAMHNPYPKHSQRFSHSVAARQFLSLPVKILFESSNSQIRGHKRRKRDRKAYRVVRQIVPKSTGQWDAN